MSVDLYCDEPLEHLLRDIGARYPSVARVSFLRLPRTVTARLRALLHRDGSTRVLPWAHLPRLAREYDSIVVPCNYLRRHGAKKSPWPQVNR